MHISITYFAKSHHRGFTQDIYTAPGWAPIDSPGWTPWLDFALQSAFCTPSRISCQKSESSLYQVWVATKLSHINFTHAQTATQMSNIFPPMATAGPSDRWTTHVTIHPQTLNPDDHKIRGPPVCNVSLGEADDHQKLAHDPIRTTGILLRNCCCFGHRVWLYGDACTDGNAKRFWCRLLSPQL